MSKSTEWLQPVAGGLMVGILGWFAPGVLGVGYGTVGDALNGKLVLGTMALLVCLKVVATATCYASGNAGGIFGPSLFMGAMLGGAFGGVAHTLWPDITGSVGAYALVGMGAAFAGIIRVPLTSVIMIFEITRDYAIIVPLMIANLISYYISMRLQEEPIYEALQHQDGIHLPSGARARQELLTVGHAFRPEAQVLDAAETIGRAASFVDRSLGAWPVGDSGGLRGMLTAEQLDRALKEGRGEQTLGDLVPEPGPIEALTHESFVHVHPDHVLDVAIRRMALSHLPVLPVVSRTNIREIKGTISMKDILDTYAIGKLPERPAAPVKSTLRIRGLIAILVVLSVVVALVNYSYRTSRANRASRDYQTANRLVQQQSYEEAIGYYRDALSVAPNIEYRLALGLALVEAGHPDEAAIYLNEAIRERPQSGRANLGLARIAAQRGNIDAAIGYYQRAAYGLWPKDVADNRLLARLEMVRLLAKAGRRPEAQAQLLAAAATMPRNPALRQQVAQLFIGLADAGFASGDYAGAREDYRNSLRFDSSQPGAAARLEDCDKILSLDPTLPGLSAVTRRQRSRELLAEVAAALADCSTARRPTPRPTTTEANLTLALQLWSTRQSSCSQPDQPDDPLALVMAKLAHRPDVSVAPGNNPAHSQALPPPPSTAR